MEMRNTGKLSLPQMANQKEQENLLGLLWILPKGNAFTKCVCVCGGGGGDFK